MKERLFQINYLLTKDEAHDLSLALEFDLFRIVEQYLEGKKSLLEVRAKLFDFNSNKYYRYAEEYTLYCLYTKIEYYKDSIVNLFDKEKLLVIDDSNMTLTEMETILIYIKENPEESKEILTREFSFTQIDFETILELIE